MAAKLLVHDHGIVSDKAGARTNGLSLQHMHLASKLVASVAY